MPSTPETIDEYLASVRPDKRAALERLPKAIRAAAPQAEHCACYPGAVVEDHTDELAGYDTSKGTIRFQPDIPLPAALVRTLVKARIAVQAARRRSAMVAGRHGRAR